MPVIRTNDIDIYYERGGEGPPLLFISGSGGDLRKKPNQFDSALAREFELLCYDQRGLGQTTQPPGDYTMQDYADDAAALLDALQIDRIPVIGVSFGGMVAQEFALRHGDRIEALVLACTSAGGAGGASYPLHTLFDLPAEERAVAHLRVADLRHSDEWIAQNPASWAKRVQLSLSAQRAEGDPSGARKQLEARRLHDTYARLPQLDMPVLLAGGTYDGIAPVANMVALQKQIPGAQLQFFQGGHMFLIQDRSAYVYISEWLKAHV